MLSVVYSSALDSLLDALIARTEAARAAHEESPLEPLRVIVPNRATAAFVRFAVAARTGIAANLDLELFERYLTERLSEARGDRPGTAATEPPGRARPERGPRPGVNGAPAVAGADTLVVLILEVLLDEEAMGDPLLAPVREYVEAAEGDRDAADLRRFQLARETARLFREYRLTRREMLAAWEHRTTLDGTAHAGVERWQRALWHRLARRLGPGAPLALLPDALERAPKPGLLLPSHLHFFGVTLFSPTHVDMLRRLAESTDVHVYALNPCREYWGDTASVDTPALTLWGRPGRATMHALNEAVGYDFEDRFPEPLEARSLLDALKNDILEGRSTDEARGAGAAGGAREHDGIAFWACPGARRELEVVASEIWRLMREDPSLSFRDVAVILAGRDRETYRAHLGAVFAETHGIPHHFHELPIRASSRIVDAIELLLALPMSSFSRQDLLRILLHPAIGAREGVDTGEWLRWLDTLGVVHGADHTDHAGTYIEHDLYNWDQGMRRLVLGALLSGERSGDDRAFEANGEAYFPLEHAFDRAENAAGLVVLVRSLIADARYARALRLRLSEWVELFGALVTSYVRAESDGDARDLELCLATIQDLAEADVVETRIGFPIAAGLVSAALERIKVGRGQPLADGVAVGSLSSLATIPFSVVFLVGLGEGQFPSGEAATQLDLRDESRRPWDASPREEDEYLFLLRLLATRDRVYLSYVSRDARTGDRLEPSSIVLELLGALEKRGDVIERVEHPLRRFDPRSFAEGTVASTPARREHAALALRESVRAALQPGSAFPELAELRRELPAAVLEPLSERLGLCPLPPPPRPAGDETVHVPLWVLRQFLEDPREAWTKLVLRLHDFDQLEDPLAKEDEAFASSALHATVLLREIFFARLQAGGDLADEGAFFREAYDTRARRLELLGVLPTGVFGDAEREKHLATLARWAELLRGEHAGELALTEGVRFGRAREDLQVGELLDPIVLFLDLPVAPPTEAEGPAGRDGARTKRRVRAEISGHTPPRLSPATTVVPGIGREASFKHVLRAFVDECANAALGRGAACPHRVLVLPGQGKPLSERFAPISAAEGAALLETLTYALLATPHAYDLPYTEVLQVNVPEPREEKRPRPSLPDAPPPSEPERKRIFEERYGLFTAKWARGAR